MLLALSSAMMHTAANFASGSAISAGVVPDPGAGGAADSPATFSPTTVVALAADPTGMIGMRIRPTTPASLGDQNNGTYVDSGDILGGGVLSYLSASAFSNVGVQASTIDHLIVYATVFASDTVPGGYNYHAPANPQTKVKVAGVANLWGLNGSWPAQADHAVLVSVPITVAPDGGPWTWAKLAALQELGVQVDTFLFAPTDTTRWFLCELAIEVYGAIGALDTPVVGVLGVAQPVQRMLVMQTPVP